jgi:hypothetical protein
MIQEPGYTEAAAPFRSLSIAPELSNFSQILHALDALQGNMLYDKYPTLRCCTTTLGRILLERRTN